MTTSKLNINNIKFYHKQMKNFFGKIANQKAKEIGFVQRQSKISGSIFLQALVWSVYRFGEIVLSSLAATAEELEPKCKVTDQAFDAKFNFKGVAFLQAMFAFALQQTTSHPELVLPLLAAFSAVYLLDSTTIPFPESLKEKYKGCGGGGSKAACKIYLLLNWINGKYEAIKIKDGKKADQNMGKRFFAFAKTKPGALWLFDLGFWDLDFLKKIVSKGSHFLCRLQAQVAISVKDHLGRIIRFDLDHFLKVAPKDGVFELAVYLGAKHYLPCRLVFIPLSPQIANSRRRRVKAAARRQGRTPKQNTLNRLDWDLFVISASEELLPTNVVGSIYRVRWQIELVFKLAKSDAKLEKTNSQKEARVLCELYAKLIALLLFERMMALALLPSTSTSTSTSNCNCNCNCSIERAISYPKAWRRLKDKILSYGRKLREERGRGRGRGRRRARERGLAQLICIIDYLQRRAKVSKRKKYPSTIQQIEIAAQNAANFRILDPIGYFEYLETMKIRRNFNHVKLPQSLMYSAVSNLQLVA